MAHFNYSISRMIIESIYHAKDHGRSDLPIFTTRLIRPLDIMIIFFGKPTIIEEKPM